MMAHSLGYPIDNLIGKRDLERSKVVHDMAVETKK